MKKLTLKALEIGAKEVLTREQLKKIVGASGSGEYCTHYMAACGSRNDYKCDADGTCC